MDCRQVRVEREWLLDGPSPNVMMGHSGANTGGLQTSALATGLASAAIDFMENESKKRPDLTEPTNSLRSEHAVLEHDLFGLASGSHECSSEDVRTAPTAWRVRRTSHVVGRERHRLRHRPPRRPVVPGGAVLFGVELPARRDGGEFVRAGGPRGLS